MNILCIRLTSMGDVILCTALLSFIKHRHPTARIVFLTDELYAPLFSGDTRIAQVIAYSSKDPAATIAQLKTTRWDAVIDLQNNRRSRRLRNAAPAPRVGTFLKEHGKRWLLLLARVDRFLPDTLVSRRYISVACRALDIAPPVVMPDLSLRIHDPVSTLPPIFRGVLADGEPILALIPFAAWKNKQWPMDRYADVGRHFMKMGWKVVLFGGPEDKSSAISLMSDMGPLIFCTAGILTLRQSATLMRQCTLALGNDTGLVHLSRACGVPTAVIFGSTTRHWGFFPYGEPASRTIETQLWCRPCHPHGGNHCLRGSSRECLKRITVDNVINQLTELVPLARKCAVLQRS